MYNFNYDGSKFKLQIANEQYFINEEKRTITVVADVRITVPEFITRTINPQQMPNGYVPAWQTLFWEEEAVRMRHTAKCSPDDEWDVDKGMKIAMAALEAKAYRSMAKRLVKWSERFNGFLMHVDTLIGDFMSKAKNAAEHDEKYIQDIA